MKPWHVLVLIGSLLAFIQAYHIKYHSHCTPQKANCDLYCEQQEHYD